ncbi:MAG TPA: alpha-amylase family glycosyl hydrolase [Roseiflexaceae bacterium]|nr:alpha-amylase family glycosyl hydrolase [Roseiflexaceae bacterium]
MEQPGPYDRIHSHLAALYGEAQAAPLLEQLRVRLERFAREYPQLGQAPPPAERLTEDDVVLITYGDQVAAPGEPPLRTLGDTLRTLFRDVAGAVHILPFYPFTSDDGFSVVDYTAVDPQLGDWEDVALLGRRYRLMFDAVVNHISASSAWFQAFLRGEPGAEARFITLPADTDVSLVTRPRTHPLLTRFDTPAGPRYVWTTFSTDQIDLNFANPDVLLAIVDVLLLYAARGAALIRLDAIGYLWKQIGTHSIHLEQAHRVVKLFRAALDIAAPGVLLITETNVPHVDNISYFGDGSDEAQLVYQFPLAPLVLHSFRSGSAHALSDWAADLQPPSDRTGFFNFLASHDGIGVVPASGILSPDDVAALVERTLQHGGRVSYKSNPDGSQSPYELNITLFDALSDPAAVDPHAVDRFAAAHAIVLALQGVPGIYVHSLIGSHNNHAGLAETGRARTINREKWRREELAARLADSDSHEAAVFARMERLIRARRAEPAFHPASPQRVLTAGDSVFALLRGAPERGEVVVCVHNVSDVPQTLALDGFALGLPPGARLRDLLGGPGATVDVHAVLSLTLAPYQTLWLRPSA